MRKLTKLFTGKMIFLDTSFIISYYNTRDQNHGKAKRVMENILNSEKKILINDYIFDECANVLLIKLKDFNNIIKICQDLKKLEIVNIDESLFDEAWDIFRKQRKTKLSFTDSTILSTMRCIGIKTLATFDNDFKKIPEISILN